MSLDDQIKEINQKFLVLGGKAILSDVNLMKLIEISNSIFEEKDLMGGQLRCNRYPKESGQESKFIQITCRADYFSDRMAYGFYPDGEVQIGAWASGVNSQAFITALEQWFDWVETQVPATA